MKAFDVVIEQENVKLTYTLENQIIKGKIIVEKRDKDTKQMLNGAVFEIIAKEDVKAADGSVLVEAGQTADKIITKDGIAESKELYLGTYLVKEIKAPEGYIPSEKSYEVHLKSQGEEIPVVMERLSIENQKEKKIMKLIKAEEVKTGDTDKMGMYGIISLLSIAVILNGYRLYRQKKKNFS